MRKILAGVTLLSLVIAGSACGGDDDGGGSDNGGAEARVVYESQFGNAVNVWSIDAATGESTQLTQDSGFTGNPGWSPDHKRIVFSSDRDAPDTHLKDLYTMAADGSDVQRLTTTAGQSEWSPKFSPDGKKVTYSIEVPGEGWFIAIQDAAGGNEERLAGPLQFSEFPAWTRDGRDIYFAAIGDNTQGVDLLGVNLESREVRTIVSTPGSDVCPHFSRDGKYMTYGRAPTPDGELDIYQRDMTSTDTTGADDVAITNNPAKDDYAAPSPEGGTVVFLSGRDGQSELYLMDEGGGNERRLTTTPGQRENVPDW
jgi:Tol biopolymer transport system component